MSRPHVLYYAQDPGGTQYLDPVISNLIAEDVFDWTILLHPFAKNSVLMDDEYAGWRVTFPDQAPVSEGYFESVLNDHQPDAVICTTSAQARDPSNGRLIATAKKNDIPCLAALDHWKGLDRFFEGSNPIYFPDQLLCIDDATKTALGQTGLDTTHVFAIGHPGLEQIKHAIPANKKSPWRILLISQPIVQGGAYHGIYEEPIGEARLIDQIADVLNDDEFEIYLRRHPKEHKGAELPISVRADEISDWHVARSHYDVFVGFDSMALIEASLSGAPCVRLTLPEMANISDHAVPMDYGVPTADLKNSPNTIRAAVAQSDGNFANPFAGSTKRAAETIRNFVNSNL